TGVQTCALPIFAEAVVALLQGDDVRLELAQDGDDPVGVATPVDAHRLVDVVAGESQSHARLLALVEQDPGIAGDVAIRGAGGQAVDAGAARAMLAGPDLGIGLRVVLEQGLALLLEGHERHAPAAAGLHALDRYVEDLAGAGQQREAARKLLPAAI